MIKLINQLLVTLYREKDRFIKLILIIINDLDN